MVDKINRPILNDNKGQMTTEIVLIMLVLVGALILVSKTFREQEFFANLVSGPWKSLSGLIQNGTYGIPQDTMGKHPSQFERVSTVRGDSL